MRRQRIDALPKKFGGKWGWRGWCGSCLRRIMLASAGGDWPICLELEQARWRPPPSRWHPAFAARGFQHTPASSQTPDLSRARCPAVPRRYAVIQQARHAHAHVTGTPPRSHVCCPPVGHTRFQSRHSRMLTITLCFGGIEDRAEGDGPLGADGTCCLNPQRGPQNTKTNG